MFYIKALAFKQDLGGLSGRRGVSDRISCLVHRRSSPCLPLPSRRALRLPPPELSGALGRGAEWGGDGFQTTNQGKYMETITERWTGRKTNRSLPGMQPHKSSPREGRGSFVGDMPGNWAGVSPEEGTLPVAVDLGLGHGPGPDSGLHLPPHHLQAPSPSSACHTHRPM